jgi:hypothetical protein
VSETLEPSHNPAQAAQQIARALESRGCDYAIGGAIALGYWAQPRGTIDVDVTLFLPPQQPTQCVRLLQQIGCNLNATAAIQSFAEHGCAEVELDGCGIHVFLPTVSFYDLARQRRKQVPLGDQQVMIWDAETLCVFKMMFFRRKDIADVEQILRSGGEKLDRAWILDQLHELYGRRDPRISQWHELVQETG